MKKILVSIGFSIPIRENNTGSNTYQYFYFVGGCFKTAFKIIFLDLILIIGNLIFLNDKRERKNNKLILL